MFNPNWHRWIVSSVNNYFNTNCGTLPMYIEDQPKERNTQKDYYELRIDGPYTYDQQGGKYDLVFEINALISSVKDDTSMYRIRQNTGLIESLCVSIPCYRYGSDPLIDDGTFLGCLELLPKTRRGPERIKTSYFGQIRVDVQIIQASVEAHYHIELP